MNPPAADSLALVRAQEAPADRAREPADDAGIIPARALLAPPQTRGRASVVRLAQHWFIGCMSTELRARPLVRTVMGAPLVLFRDATGAPGALLDRCPHRNVPLSTGSVVAGEMECGYHGWRFDREGTCRGIPSLCGDPAGKARRALAYPTREQDGFVWVYGSPGDDPGTEPYRFPEMHARGYTTVRQVVSAQSTMHAAIENALDVPHTAFLHKGLFRSKSRGIEIVAHVKRAHDRVEAEYVGEPRPAGLVARILSPSGGMVTHYDRFILPSIAQVEYRIGTENHFLVTSAMTPVEDFETRLYAVVSFRSRVPAWLIKPFLRPLALKIFRQDATMLKLQTENIRRFGGEQFASTEIDVLGGHIWRLLKAAERGEVPRPDAPVHEEQVTLVV